MLVPTPQTLVTNQRWTAALGNLLIRDAVTFLLQQPYCLAYCSGSPTLTTAVWGVVPFASEESDTDVMHDNVTNNSRVVAKTAGLYVVTANVTHVAVNTTGLRRAQIRKNAAGAVGGGAAVILSSVDNAPTAATISANNMSRIIPMAANDYLEVFAFQSSGGNNTLQTGSEQTFLHMARIYT